MWNSPVARVGHGEQEEISRAREQERTNPHLHGKDLGAVRQNDSLPRWGDRFLLPVGKESGEGGPGNWDCGVTLKNMRKTPGDGGARPGSGGRAETWALFVSEALSSSLEFWEGHVYQAGVRDLVDLKGTCLQGERQTEDPVPKDFAVNL